MVESFTLARPRTEDFGISREDLAAAPRPWLMHHRPHILFALFIGVVSVVSALFLDAGSPVSAAAMFSIILVGAWAIVLVPVFICLLCASEELERRFLCRRYPLLGACLSYRRALDEYRSNRARAQRSREDLGWWSSLSSAAYRFEIERRLGGLEAGVSRPDDRETVGYDLEVDRPDGRILVRCEPGDRPVAISVARELMSCLEETGADRAVVVSAAGPSPALSDYLGGRPLEVVDPVGFLD